MKLRHGLLAALLWACLFPAIGQAQYLEQTIRLSGQPLSALWNPTGNKAYVGTWAGLVTVIDGATNEVIANVAVGDYPLGLCWNSVNNKVYATYPNADMLYVIDAVGDTLIKRVTMSGYPRWMTFNPKMNRVYVDCRTDHAIRVYDGAADTLAAEMRFGGQIIPYKSLWHPAFNRLFCATYGSYPDADTVYVIDCSADTITERWPTGAHPSAMCRNPADNLVYVAAQDTVYAFSPSGDSVKARIPVRGEAHDVCAVPYPNKLYVSSDYGPQLFVIDCSTHTVKDSLTMGTAFLVCDTVKAKVYATGWPGHVLDARADTVIKTIPKDGSTIDHICWNSVNNRIYWSNFNDTAVYVIRDTSTAIAEQPQQPEFSSVLSVQPNPFSRNTEVIWDSPAKGGGAARVFARDGRLVRQARIPAGENRWVWDGRDDSGAPLPPGVYVIEAGAGLRAKVVKLR